jgi:WD40 repeat protein
MSRIAITFCLFILISLAQQSLAAVCEPPKPVFNTNAENIFTDEQEMILGEAVFEQLKNGFDIIEDEAINGPVRRIAERLVKHLPETGINFRIYIVDMPDTNAFITPGGNVFITKKLVAFVESEDELAGIIGHELGHGVVHHSAIDISKGFRKILEIKEVGDRSDIIQKFNEYLDNRARKSLGRTGHVGKQQIEADSIGLYAMTAAGYKPEASASAYDRLTESEGKTGGWWSDFTGKTRPEQKRLRVIIDNLKTLPKECLSKEAPLLSTEFEDWQTSVLLHRSIPKAIAPDYVKRKIQLSPKLRDDIAQLSFSPDGNLVLARDESSVFVIQKDPYENLFRIDIKNVSISRFSADSKFVLILTRDLRYEKWDIQAKKPKLVREIHIADGCEGQELSPDGKSLACVQSRGGIRFYDLDTKKIVFRKDGFLKLGKNERVSTGFFSRGKSLQMEFSPSGRYFVATKKARVRRDYRTRTEDSYFGYDFSTGKEISIPGSLKQIVALPFAFTSDTEIVGQHPKDPKKSGLFGFPSGKRVESIEFKANSISSSSEGRYLLVRPIKIAPVGVFDLRTKKFVIANQKSALAVFGNTFVSENKDGVLGYYRLDKDETLGQLDLPDSRLGALRTLAVSPDLNWIAISDSQRGAIWSLYSGERFSYSTGFDSAYFDKSGKVYLDFLKTKKTARQIGVFDLGAKALAASNADPDSDSQLHGPYLIKNSRENPRRQNLRGVFTETLSGLDIIILGPQLKDPGQVEVSDVKTSAVLWNRKFAYSRPSVSVNTVEGIMTLRWSLGSPEVKEIAKSDPPLKKIISDRKESRGDYYFQFADLKFRFLQRQTKWLLETAKAKYQFMICRTDVCWSV